MTNSLDELNHENNELKAEVSSLIAMMRSMEENMKKVLSILSNSQIPYKENNPQVNNNFDNIKTPAKQ